jgi:hypothetical protein
MPLLDCQHDSPDEAQHVCRHLLASIGTGKGAEYIQRFSGNRLAFGLICPSCIFPGMTLCAVCQECFRGIQAQGRWDGTTMGSPEVQMRDTELSFHHESVLLSDCSSGNLLDVQPVPSVDQNLWVAVTRSGQLLRLDLDRRSAVPLCQLPESPVNLAEPITLHLSRNGQMAAMVNTRDRYGIVFDLDTAQTTLLLDRGDEDTEHCNYPVAFCEVAGRLLLIHATAWNRLDISDPKTGELLTERTFGSPRPDTDRPEHDLDYFHCGLNVSPSQEYVADNGWVWHPFGVVATWSIRRWLGENVWESEDGPSKHELCHRSGYWDGPLCWVGANRLAVWGYGEDGERLLAAVRIFNVVSGEEEKWFPGPYGNLIYDRYLFSLTDSFGVLVWDVDRGEHLLRDGSFCPLRYHPGAKAFLTLRPDGWFQVSKLRGQPLDLAWLTWNGGTVVRMAQSINQQRTFDHLPVLADALEEAGCQDAEILAHCRQPGPHTAACWVVDWLLGRG